MQSPQTVMYIVQGTKFICKRKSYLNKKKDSFYNFTILQALLFYLWWKVITQKLQTENKKEKINFKHTTNEIAPNDDGTAKRNGKEENENKSARVCAWNTRGKVRNFQRVDKLYFFLILLFFHFFFFSLFFFFGRWIQFILLLNVLRYSTVNIWILVNR